MATPRKNYRRDFPRLITRLENRIVTGRFLPRERLVEADLADRFQVSRAWIRDALKILETKGLVEMTPFRGARVAELSEIEIEELFQIRVALEKLCNRLALENFRPQHGRRLRTLAGRIRAAHQRGEFEEMLAANTEFHQQIAGIAGNRELARMLRRLRTRFHIFNTFAWSSPEEVEKILREHERTVTALEEGEGEILDRLAESHFAHSKDLYLKRLKGR